MSDQSVSLDQKLFDNVIKGIRRSLSQAVKAYSEYAVSSGNCWELDLHLRRAKGDIEYLMGLYADDLAEYQKREAAAEMAGPKWTPEELRAIDEHGGIILIRDGVNQ